MKVLRKKRYRREYTVPGVCNDYDQSCSNEACAAGFVWGPNKWVAFVFAPVEPVEIYYEGPDRKENPVQKERKNFDIKQIQFLKYCSKPCNQTTMWKNDRRNPGLSL